MSDIRLGIIGAGNIAKEHLDVIRIMDGVSVKGITSRTKKKAKQIASKYKIDNIYNDIDHLLQKCSIDGLLVLVSADQIFEVTRKLIPTRIPLFIEKPPGIDPKQTKTLALLTNKYNTNTFVGYNRRYYSIFHKGIDLINKNGNLLGISIEGHERFWKVLEMNISTKIRENWIYANSTHTINLLELFGGKISKIKTFNSSYKENNGDQFVSSMQFSSGVLGTYSSYWYSPGGWSVNLYLEGMTIIYKPLEKGYWIDNQFNKHTIDPDEEDLIFKPGFYKQMQSFIEMLINGTLPFPGVNIEKSLETMELAKKLIYV